MDPSQILFNTLVILHGVGIILFIINAVYLWCSRGQGSVKLSKRRLNSRCCNPEGKRCCKLKKVVLGKFLVYFQVILTFADIAEAVYQEITYPRDEFLRVGFRMLFLFSYVTLWIVMVPRAWFLTNETNDDLEAIHRNYAFEFLHFVVLWASIYLVVSCLGTDCQDYEPPSGFALLFSAASYIAVLLESVCYQETVTDIVTKEEAVNMIKRRKQETPSIQWTVSCSHKDKRHRIYRELHRETKVHVFTDSDFHTKVTPTKAPTEAMFSRQFTKLNIVSILHPGDASIQREIANERDEFFKQHKGHDKKLSLSTKNRVYECYLVRKSDSGCVPMCLTSSKLEILFAVLGLSIPYQLFLYLSQGHVKFIIKKNVYSDGIQSSMAPNASLVACDTPQGVDLGGGGSSKQEC